MVRIAVDAMGGDNAPHDIINGAIESARRSKGRYEIVLVGDQEVIEKELKHHLFIKDLPISIEHASQVVGMEEAPATALRKKPDSSIAVATKLHKMGKVQGVVSAGNTGAVMAAALFVMERIEGVMRPSIGSMFPHEAGVSFLIDVGANVECKPAQLLQFGMMGSIFINHYYGIENPRVGLVNIGEEESKGTESIQQTYQLLKSSPLNFVGNLEGNDILRGKADVIVCDGFVGNLLVKFSESIDRMVSLGLKKTIGGNLQGSLGHWLIQPKFRMMWKIFDYQEYGGAPLLGVKGNFVICHGRSNHKAIRRAVVEVLKMVEEKIADHIETKIGMIEGLALEK